MTKQQIDTKKKPEEEGSEKKKDDKPKDEMGRPLTEQDI